MGCTSSKLDDLPAVSLCRDRCSFLDEAIRQRFAFAEAHLAYTHSLQRIGNCLHHFMEQHHGSSIGITSFSPKLNLPPQRKGDHDLEPTSPKRVYSADHHSRSSSGSHLQFHSDDDSVSHLHSDQSSPLHQHINSAPGGHIEYMNAPNYMNLTMDQDSFTGVEFSHMNYMKNKATPPSIVYAQKPMSPETAYFSESSASYPYFGYPSYGYSTGDGGGGDGAMTRYYGAQTPYGSPPVAALASSSKPPPPAPSPPRASAWDFLNPFESHEKYNPQYTPSGYSMEDVDYQREVVKEVHGDQNNVGTKSVMTDDVHDGGGDGRVGSGSSGRLEASLYQTRPSVSAENDRMEYEVPVVDKKTLDNNDRSEKRSRGSRDAAQVAVDIKFLFEKASQCGSEVAKMLEIGRLPHQRKHVSKILQGVTTPLSAVASQPSTFDSGEASTSADNAGPLHIEIDEELTMKSKNLSSTLHKLYLWEKKLYNEVKIEEKMRVVHERKCRKLKRFDERGAEVHKVDATRTLIRSLSTKIRMAIQVVDKTSVTINNIRDEELWPQLNELIHGLTMMWKSMLECHHNQCQAIKEARGLGPTGSGKKLNDNHLHATLQLERELLSWTSSFSRWISSQKGYVRALNSWLVKCLLHEPEETPDGIVPFSPGRMGAPSVFVICNQWAQAMDRISERRVIDSMRIFAMSVLQLWEQDKLEMLQMTMANKDLEKKVRNLDREDQKIQKEIQALDKNIVLVAGDGSSLSVTGNIVYQSDTGNASLQRSLQRIFEAMENFMTDLMKEYEELIQRTEEDRLARENERGL